MKLNKGDLIAIRDLKTDRLTAIVVQSFEGDQFVYCFCVDHSEYRLIHASDIDFVIVKEFDPTFPVDPNFFDIDYSFYEVCMEIFSGYPYIPYYPNIDDDSEDD